MVRVESCLSVRSYAKTGSFLLVSGAVRTSFFPPALDLVHLASAPLVKSFSRPDPALLVLDSSHLDFPSLLQSPSKTGPFLLFFASTRLGLFLLVLDFATLDLSTSLQSYLHLDSALPVLDLLHMGSVVFTQALACLGFRLLVSGRTKLELLMLAFDFVQLGLLFLLRSSA